MPQFITPGSVLSASGSGSYTLLASQSLSADQASFDFQGISASYSHLQFKTLLRSDRADVNDFMYIHFNNDTGTNYDHYIAFYTASSTLFDAAAATAVPRLGLTAGSTATANHYYVSTIDVNFYQSNVHKEALCSFVGQFDTTSGDVDNGLGMVHWRNIAVINRVTIVPLFGTNWKASSQINMYGIL